MVDSEKDQISKDIEARLKKDGFVIFHIPLNNMIHELLPKTEEQSTSLPEVHEDLIFEKYQKRDLIFEQYQKLFNAVEKGNVKKYLIFLGDEIKNREGLVFLVDHDRYPLFKDIHKELIRKEYQELTTQQ